MRLIRTRKCRRFIRRLSYWVPRLEWVYRVCKLYIDNYHADNNADMRCNGELQFLRRTVAFVSRYCSEPVIFDVGANHGVWCREVLAVNPRARVHCFEPATSTWEELKRSRLPPNVVCNRLALGAQKGTLQLNIVAPGSELNSFHPLEKDGSSSTENVTVSTVADYCDEHHLQHVDFLKIDAEGHDFAVLEGAADVLGDARISFVQFEYGQGFIPARVFLRDIFEFLKRFNYDIYKIRPDGLTRVAKYSSQLERFENANYTLVSRRLPAFWRASISKSTRGLKGSERSR